MKNYIHESRSEDPTPLNTHKDDDGILRWNSNNHAVVDLTKNKESKFRSIAKSIQDITKDAFNISDIKNPEVLKHLKHVYNEADVLYQDNNSIYSLSSKYPKLSSILWLKKSCEDELTEIGVLPSEKKKYLSCFEYISNLMKNISNYPKKDFTKEVEDTSKEIYDLYRNNAVFGNSLNYEATVKNLPEEKLKENNIKDYNDYIKWKRIEQKIHRIKKMINYFISPCIKNDIDKNEYMGYCYALDMFKNLNNKPLTQQNLSRLGLSFHLSAFNNKIVEKIRKDIIPLLLNGDAILTLDGVLKRGKPMSHDEADKGRANPYIAKTFSAGYYNNCQTCIVIGELRRRGFDVIATPKLARSINDALSVGINSLQCFDSKSDTAQYFHYSKNSQLSKEEQAYDFLYKNIKIGERHGIVVVWNGGGGHAFNIEKNNFGNLVLTDYQASGKNTNIDGFVKGSIGNSFLNNLNYNYGVRLFTDPTGLKYKDATIVLKRIDNLPIDTTKINTHLFHPNIASYISNSYNSLLLFRKANTFDEDNNESNFDFSILDPFVVDLKNYKIK